MEQKDATDHKKDQCRGRGTWYVLHFAALNVKSPADREHVMWLLDLLTKQYHCLECRTHLQEYVKRHPYRKIKVERDDTGRDLSLFKYLWTLHNTVNLRLDKSIVSWEEALFVYSPANVCTEDCSDESPKTTKTSPLEDVSYAEESESGLNGAKRTERSESSTSVSSTKSVNFVGR